MRWGIILLLGLGTALAAPASAWAESPPTTEPAATAGAVAEPPPAGADLSLADARAAQAQAAQLFRENKYTEAAELLRLSYRGDPRPILLFNAGQAYRKADNPMAAKQVYELFLSVAPQHPLAPETRGYLKDMEALLSTQARAQQVARALEERLAATKRSEKQTARALEAEQLRSLQTNEQLLQTQAQLERERHKPLHQRPWFWGVMTGVAVVVISAVAVGTYVGVRGTTEGGTVLISN
jgi:tetratricopeptide (TPR) repeat protein